MKLQYNLVTWKYYKLIHKWRSSKNINSLMLSHVNKNYNEHLDWLQKVKDDNKFDHWIFLIDNIPSGYLSLKLENRANASFGYYFINQKTPLGSLMPLYFYNFFFKNSSINKISGEVLKKNTNILKLHLSCNYVIKKTYKNSYLMELKKKNWDFEKYSQFHLNFPIRRKLKYLMKYN